MQSPDFFKKTIRLEHEVPGYTNDPSIPVMVQDAETGELFTIKELEIEQHEPGGYTFWIKVVTF